VQPPIEYARVDLQQDTTGLPYEEKLVHVAWRNYPVNQTHDHRIMIAHKNTQLARWSWTNNLRMFYNLNDRTWNNMIGDGNGGGGGMGIPMYGLGLSVNLGDFISVPARIRMAKEQEEIAKLDMGTQKLTMRSEVLRRYNAYKLAFELMQTRTQAFEDANANFVLMSSKFRSGEITLEQYNGISSHYNSALEGKMASQTEHLNTKLLLEELLGVPLESIR
jgi:outer membrane protein TolC